MDSIAAYIGKNEALRLTVYDDKTGKPVGPGDTLQGHPTIGYGRALDVKGITAAQAAYLLADDVAECDADLRTLFDGVDVGRWTALMDMRFTLGPGGFREFHGVIAAVKAGDWDAAADAALDSEWARAEAPARAAADAELLRHGLPP